MTDYKTPPDSPECSWERGVQDRQAMRQRYSEMNACWKRSVKPGYEKIMSLMGSVKKED
jgi:hypothetical protein